MYAHGKGVFGECAHGSGVSAECSHGVYVGVALALALALVLWLILGEEEGNGKDEEDSGSRYGMANESPNISSPSMGHLALGLSTSGLVSWIKVEGSSRGVCYG